MEPHRHTATHSHHPDCDHCRGCVVGMCMALAGCASAPAQRQPMNLLQAKAAVSAYCDSGAYDRDLAVAGERARVWIERRVAHRSPGERLAVVFDVDETVLSNAPLIRRLDYAYLPGEWEQWFEAAEAPAIEPIRQVFELAVELRVAAVFVTGRRDPSHRAATERNLSMCGMDGYDRLVMAPVSHPRGLIAGFKASAREALQREGFAIIANIGDQESDLWGGHSERSFKLPDPFYLVE